MEGPGGIMTLVLGIVLSFISYLWVYRWRQRNQLGPKTWPIIGTYLEISANQHRVHDWILDYMKKSPTASVSVNLLGRDILFIGHPDNVQHILKSNFTNYPKGPFLRKSLAPVIGYGIFSTDGEIWRRHRKISSHEFTPRKLRVFSTVYYRKLALQLLGILDTFTQTKTHVDIQDLFFRMTMDSICKIGFGVEQENLSPALPIVSVTKAFDRAMVLIQERTFGISWKIRMALNMGPDKEALDLYSQLDEFSYGVIGIRRSELMSLKAAGQSVETHDLLSRFMEAKDENGNSLKDKELRDAILNFIAAGRDTSAITLSWFVYLLCKNPEVVELCYQEICRVLGEPKDTAGKDKFSSFAELLTYQAIGELQYLHATLSETLRLYPPVPKDGKYVLNDDVLPDGTFLKANSAVTYCQYAMGRLESIWGPDAMEFRPQRWIRNGVFQPESSFKFSAFQAGPRECLGKETAYLQMKITAALLIRFFRIELVPNQTVQYVPSILLPIRNGLKVIVSHR